MNEHVLIIVLVCAICAVNIAAFKYIGLFGFFVSAASIPFIDKVFDIINKVYKL